MDLVGDVSVDGWREGEVEEAIDSMFVSDFFHFLVEVLEVGRLVVAACHVVIELPELVQLRSLVIFHLHQATY